MPKIVILGSCRFAPYVVLCEPEKINDGTKSLWNTEEGYKEACERFYPAIAEADVVWVYAPDGIGEHTRRDIAEAFKQGKKVMRLVPMTACPKLKGEK